VSRARRRQALGGEASERARKAAAAILQVMAGLKTPTEVSGVLGVSLNRYYQLETRGLQALIKAMEPRPRGRSIRPEAEVARLEKAKASAERDATRYQALLRASQKALGFAAVSVHRGDSKRKARRPRVRAKTLIQALDQLPEAPAPAATPTP
jgi:hypothetical protein